MITGKKTRELQAVFNNNLVMYPTPQDLQQELSHYNLLIRAAQKALRTSELTAIAHALNINYDKQRLEQLEEERDRIVERLLNENSTKQVG